MNENFIKSSFTETRNKHFREKLVDFIKEFHKEFLYENNQENMIERLETAKVWHREFDINNEKLEIPQRKLLEKPICNREVQSVSEFLKNCEEGAIRNKSLMGIMKEVADKNPKVPRNVDDNTRKLGISEQLLAKVY
jgi:hypothetical protein